MRIARGTVIVWIVWLASGCGGASTGAPRVADHSHAAAAPPRAPVCTHDDAWELEDRLVWRLFDLAGTAAYIAEDRDRRRIFLRALEGGRSLGDLSIAAPGLEILASEVLAASDGVTLLVTGDKPPKHEGDESLTSSYWLLPVDGNGRAGSAVPIALPDGHSYELDMIAVGDHYVALLDVPTEPPDDFDAPQPPKESYLVILDRKGNVVRQRRELELDSIVGIGDHAFAAVTYDQGASALRVFDLAALDWIGPATRTDHETLDALSLGGRAVLVGALPGDATESEPPRQLAIATVAADGSLSAWKPIGLAASDARLVRGVTPDTGLLLAWQFKENVMTVSAVNADLAFSPPSPPTRGPAGGLGTQVLAERDALYVSAWGHVDRFSCTAD